MSAEARGLEHALMAAALRVASSGKALSVATAIEKIREVESASDIMLANDASPAPISRWPIIDLLLDLASVPIQTKEEGERFRTVYLRVWGELAQSGSIVNPALKEKGVEPLPTVIPNRVDEAPLPKPAWEARALEAWPSGALAASMMADGDDSTDARIQAYYVLEKALEDGIDRLLEQRAVLLERGIPVSVPGSGKAGEAQK